MMRVSSLLILSFSILLALAGCPSTVPYTFDRPAPASEPSVAEVTVSTQMNTSSVYMFQEACTGQQGKEVKIHLVSTGSPGQTYVEYTLTDTLVSGYSVSSAGDRPSESLTLNFTKVEMKYIPLEANNEAGSPITKGYDLKTTKAV